MATSDSSPSGIRVSLNNVDLWQQFYPNNEMVVRKLGSKLFPDLDVKIEGLVPEELYTVSLYLKRVDNIKYTYSNGQWKEADIGDKILPVDKKQHKDGGMVGAHWMSDPVSFSDIHITNDRDYEQKSRKNDLVLLSSMHKYQPVITVKRLSDGKEEEFRLTMTEFMAVTAYQDRKIVELKKTLNKFAGGAKTKKRAITFDTDTASPPAKKTPPPMTPSTMITPPSMTPSLATPPSQGYQNQVATPPAMTMTPYPLNQQAGTPPMFPTPMTPSTMTPSSMGYNNYQNQMTIPSAMTMTTPPSQRSMNYQNQYMTPPSMATPPAHGYTMNQNWNPYTPWNMPQTPMTPMPAQFGHPGSMQQNNNYNGGDMSFLNGSTAAEFDFRFDFQ